MNQRQQPNKSQLIDKRKMENLLRQDVREMFEQLKSEGENVQKSTLISLLLYCQVEKTQPEFFFLLKKQLNKINKTELNLQAFEEILLNPNVDFKSLSHDEISAVNTNQLSKLITTQVFRIFDKNLHGSFSADDFLQIYQFSDEFDKSRQREIETEVRQLFKDISPSGEITPVEFYNMIHYDDDDSNQGYQSQPSPNRQQNPNFQSPNKGGNFGGPNYPKDQFGNGKSNDYNSNNFSDDFKSNFKKDNNQQNNQQRPQSKQDNFGFNQDNKKQNYPQKQDFPDKKGQDGFGLPNNQNKPNQQGQPQRQQGQYNQIQRKPQTGQQGKIPQKRPGSKQGNIPNQQPRVNNQPGVRPNQSGVRQNQPGVRPQQPGVRQNQPDVRQNQPDVRKNQPGGRQQQPGNKPNQPPLKQGQYQPGLQKQQNPNFQNNNNMPNQVNRNQKGPNQNQPLNRNSGQPNQQSQQQIRQNFQGQKTSPNKSQSQFPRTGNQKTGNY